MITRFEKDLVLFTGATDAAAAIHWTPGAYNSNPNAVGGKGLVNAVSTTDAGALTWSDPTSSVAPGYSFLVANASSYRCIAACAQVYWPGTELNRQGIVSGAQATYGLVDKVGSATSQTVSGLRSLSPIVERMPSDHLEFRWAPNAADGLFHNPESAGSVPEDGHSSLLLTFAGLPGTVGVRVRFVAVYEWNPRITDMVISSNTSGVVRGSLQGARQVLDSINPNWWYSAGQFAGRIGSAALLQFVNNRMRQQARTASLTYRDEL